MTTKTAKNAVEQTWTIFTWVKYQWYLVILFVHRTVQEQESGSIRFPVLYAFTEDFQTVNRSSKHRCGRGLVWSDL